MGADTVDSHKLNGKVQTDAEARERFAYEKKQRRLANNRVTASQSREKKRGYLQSLKHRVESLELERTKLKQAVLHRDEQLLQIRGLSATHPQEKFDGVDKGLQPDKDKPPGPPICIVLSPAAPNLHIKIPQPPSSCPVRGEHHDSIANISSQQLLAIQDAPPTSMFSDTMDQNQGLPDYLLDLFLHSPGKVGHMSPNALENLEVPSQEDWACAYPKTLQEAQTESSGPSVQGAASSWSVPCSRSDIQQGQFTTLGSFSDESSLSAEKQVCSMQDVGITVGCTKVCERNETFTAVSAPGQAEQTWPSQWDPLHCTTSFDNMLSCNGHGIARQDVTSDSVPWFSTAANKISTRSSTHFDSHPEDINHCALREMMDIYFVRPCGKAYQVGDIQPPE